MIVGINQAQEKIISEILKNYFGEFEFFYYGSRVKGGFEATSDLDILVKKRAEISKNSPKDSLENSPENSSENSPKTRREILEQIKEKFDQSLLPFIVNLTDYFGVEKKFYQAIKPDLVRVGGEDVRSKMKMVSCLLETDLRKSKNKKVKRSEYQNCGIYPIIDQSQSEIAGYIDDESMLYQGKLPVIVFGDHTRVLKFINFPFCIGADGTQIIYPTKNVDVRYFYYALRNLNLKNYGYERHFKYLKQEEIPLPPLPIQKKIADILSAYDDLIENNNRRIKILEEMAQKIYKEWFVNFKFPGHQNAKFVDSALGKIPEGWEVFLANDVTNILIGRTPPRKENHWFSNEKSDNLPWLSIRDLGANHIFTGATSEYLTKEAVLKHNVPMVKKNTVLVSFKLTVGKVAIATEDICTNEAIAQFPIADSSHLTTYFLYSYLVDFKYPSLGNTSSIGNAVNSTILKNMPILIPPKNLVEEYTRFVAPVFKNIKIFLSQNQTLRQTRDILLPRLISGELSVENLEVKI